MTRRPDVQYIRFYTDGSAAKKAAPAFSVQPSTVKLPKVKKQKCRRIYIDPVATLGIMTAICMMVLMIVGIFQFAAVRQQTKVMEQYVVQLSDENVSLNQEYVSGYDLEEVKETALALGLVPMESVERITIAVPAEVQQPEQTATLWEYIGTFLTRLFA